MPNIFKRVKKIFDPTNYSSGSKSYIGRTDEFRKEYIGQLFNDFQKDLPLGKEEKISAVYASIKLLAESVSKCQIRIVNEDGVVKNNLSRVLNYKPNAYTNRQSFYSTIVTNLCLAGNCYAEQLVDDLTGEPLSIEFYPLDFFDKIFIRNGKKWYYNKEFDYITNSDKILHWYLISKDGLKGMSPIESLRNEIQVNWISLGTVRKHYKKNAQSNIAFEWQGVEYDADKVNELIKKFEQDNAGVRTATIIPPNFKMHELKMSVEDQKFLESTQMTGRFIAGLFGIPVNMLGFEGGAQFSKYEEQHQYLLNTAIGAMFNIIETELEFKLLNEKQMDEGYKIEFDVEKLTATTAKDRAQYYQILRNSGALTANQLITKLGYPKIDNKYADMHVMQKQYVFIEDGLVDSDNNNNKKSDNNDK